MKIHGSTGFPTAKVVVKTIREEFPSPIGNYEGFKECACESDISDSD
jgi:hypothetical protein